MAPKFLEKYFWDINFSSFQPKKHPRFTIERILEYGDQQAVHWMRKNFSPSDIKEAIKHSRSLSLKSLNFWSLIYRLEKECRQQFSQRKQSIAWKY